MKGSLAQSGGEHSKLIDQLDEIESSLAGKSSLRDVPSDERWQVRQSIYRFGKEVDQAKLSPELTKELTPHRKVLKHSIEYVPFWVVLGVALALGIGTTIGYKRIVVTIAEKIGKTHLTYAQGAAAETVAAITIGLADIFHAPVSTTQVLSSGIAGTMWANKSGVQLGTIRKILIAWVLTLPMAILLGGILFFLGVWISGE
jgi:phosphate/sulfate permease